MKIRGTNPLIAPSAIMIITFTFFFERLKIGSSDDLSGVLDNLMLKSVYAFLIFTILENEIAAKKIISIDKNEFRYVILYLLIRKSKIDNIKRGAINERIDIIKLTPNNPVVLKLKRVLIVP